MISFLFHVSSWLRAAVVVDLPFRHSDVPFLCPSVHSVVDASSAKAARNKLLVDTDDGNRHR